MAHFRGIETIRNNVLETPPPGGGFTTVTAAVPGVVIFDAGTVAVSWELLANIVASADPFQLTPDPDTNPEPFTVRVNAALPGAKLVGTRGLLISGTGFGMLCPATDRTEEKNSRAGTA